MKYGKLVCKEAFFLEDRDYHNKITWQKEKRKTLSRFLSDQTIGVGQILDIKSTKLFLTRKSEQALTLKVDRGTQRSLSGVNFSLLHFYSILCISSHRFYHVALKYTFLNTYPAQGQIPLMLLIRIYLTASSTYMEWVLNQCLQKQIVNSFHD